MDGEVAKQFQRILEKQGFEFKLGSKVTKVRDRRRRATVTVEPAKGGDGDDARGRRGAGRHRPPALHRRASASRRPASRSTRGRVVIDDHFRTNVPGIYAIGDVIAGRCSPTRPRTRASPWPRSSPARPAT